MSILDLIFPKRCIYCLSGGSYVCNKCTKRLRSSLPECYKCRRLSSYYKTHTKCNDLLIKHDELDSNSTTNINENALSWVTYLWVYNDAATQLMKEAKYNGSFDIFTNLGEIISNRLRSSRLPLKRDINYLIAPIPQHRQRRFLRGFEHSTILAKVFYNVLGEMGFKVQFEKNLLRKTRENKRQASLSKEERLENSVGVFSCNEDLLNGSENLILIDDVITTGSTLHNAALTVKNYTKRVDVSAIALFRGRARYKNDL